MSNIQRPMRERMMKLQKTHTQAGAPSSTGPATPPGGERHRAETEGERGVSGCPRRGGAVMGWRVRPGLSPTCVVLQEAEVDGGGGEQAGGLPGAGCHPGLHDPDARDGVGADHGADEALRPAGLASESHTCNWPPSQRRRAGNQHVTDPLSTVTPKSARKLCDLGDKPQLSVGCSKNAEITQNQPYAVAVWRCQMCSQSPANRHFGYEPVLLSHR